MNSDIFDLIIVGSGSVGAAAGYYTAQAGLKVLMIDNNHPPHDQGSHHGETRLIRHAYGEGVSYVPMVLRAQKLWNDLEQKAGERIMHHCGLLTLAPRDSTFIRNVIDSANRYELRIEIMPAIAVMKRWPQISVPVEFLGAYELNSGYLESEVAIRNYIRFAKESGCQQLFNCPVTSITRDGDLQCVQTVNGSFFGRKVLLSTGTWLKKLLNDLPITPTRKVFTWHNADERYDEENNFPGFIIVKRNGENYYGFPAKDNLLKIGKHNGGQPINSPDECKPFGDFEEDKHEVSDILKEFFPGVGELAFGKSCSYDLTLDNDFIIDRQPGEPNRLIINGLSGHGFKFASVLGEIAALFAQDKPLPYDLTPFSLSRFANRQ